MENVVNSATHDNQTHSVPCAVTSARIINESKAVNSPCGRSSPSAASTLVYSTIPTTSTVYQFAHSGTSTLTFRLAASGPIHDTVSSSTAMSSSCSLIFDATMLETHGTSSVQRQVNFTSASTPVSVGPACLVMSSDGSSAQRVLIQKATGTLQPLRSTVSSDPFTVLGAVDVSSSGATTFLHAVKPATSSSHPSAPLTLHSPKTKLVNLTPPTSTGVRLLASATPKAATSSTPPATFHVSPSLVVQSGISPLKAGSIPTPHMGLAPPNKLQPTAPSSVTVHHPQPLLVRTSSDCTIGITRDQSIYPASSVPSTVSPQLYASTPTVLAFSLTPGMPSTTNISNPNVIAQVNPSTKANVQVSVNSPLVIRASYTPSSPSSSAQPLSAASLLKPFSLSIATTTQTISSSTPAHPVLGQTSVQHVIPVNITPAKLSPFQPPVSTVSLVRHHSAVPISPRHVPASVVAQANRRRARKQQLATGSGETSPTNQPASTAVGVEGSRPVSQTTIAMSVATLAEGQPAQTTTVVPSASSVKTTWTHSIPDCPASTDNLTNSNVLGIRLVSVRPNNASSNTPNGPEVDYSMSTPVTIQEAPINLLGTLSPLVSTGFARPATSTLEQPCSQTSAVYVLTSSSCPVVNTNMGTPSSGISSVTLPAPTFHTPASLIPCCGNLVQFRLQSPILTTGTSYKASEPLSVHPSVRLNDATVSATSGNLHPPSLNCFVTEAISKPRTTSQVSPCESTQPYNNSLPHRGPHLSSPNNSHGNYMNVEISRPTLIATDPQDVRPTRGPLTRDIDSTWVFRRTRLPSDVTNPSDDASSENLTLPPHSTKRLKIHNEAYPSSQSSGPENTPSANEKCSIMSHDSQGLLSTLPSRPSMMPHPPSTRSTGALVRSKSSHFLSLADIRHKPASRFDRPRDTLSGHAPGSALAETERSKLAKRRRRANARRVADIQPPSATDASPSSPRDLSASERRLLHDLASLLLRQKEMKFVNFPLTVASVISLTGWRTLSCVNNLDLLLSTERDTLRSFEAVIPDLNALLQSGPSNPSVRLDAPLSTQPTSISSTNSSDRPGTPERLSTASVLTSFSALATSSDLHPDVHSELEKALELIKGITQRKNSLISSIDHLRSLTTNVLEHFRSSIASHIGEFEQAYGTAADSVPSSSRTAARSNEDEQSLKRSRGRSSEAMPEKQQETEVNACNGFMDGGSVR